MVGMAHATIRDSAARANIYPILSRSRASTITGHKGMGVARATTAREGR